MRGAITEKTAAPGIDCRPPLSFQCAEGPHLVRVFTMARPLLRWRGAALCDACWDTAMLLALGAASAALNAIKSLTPSKPTSSQPIGFGPAGASWTGDSTPPPAGATATAGSSSGPQISSENFNALLDAQSQSTGFGTSGTSANSTSLPTTSSGAASSAYSAVDQAIQRQSTPALLPTPPISFSA
jgi:hypothetical protein